MDKIEFSVSNEDIGLRIDKWLSAQDIDVTRSAVQKVWSGSPSPAQLPG